MVGSLLWWGESVKGPRLSSSSNLTGILNVAC